MHLVGRAFARHYILRVAPCYGINRAMPDYRRLYADGGTYFLTLCLNDRRSDILIRHIDLLRTSWREVFVSRPVETIAAVVLREHMHFLWRLPDDDCAFAARVAQLKAGFTRRLPEIEKGKGRRRTGKHIGIQNANTGEWIKGARSGRNIKI